MDEWSRNMPNTAHFVYKQHGHIKSFDSKCWRQTNDFMHAFFNAEPGIPFTYEDAPDALKLCLQKEHPIDWQNVDWDMPFELPLWAMLVIGIASVWSIVGIVWCILKWRRSRSPDKEAERRHVHAQALPNYEANASRDHITSSISV